MSRTVAEAAAAYRKRRGEKLARYEAALRLSVDRFEKACGLFGSSNPAASALCVSWAQDARNALNPNDAPSA